MYNCFLLTHTCKIYFYSFHDEKLFMISNKPYLKQNKTDASISNGTFSYSIKIFIVTIMKGIPH